MHGSLGSVMATESPSDSDIEKDVKVKVIM